ncbi:MAG: sugar phosphate isomerase/epimerase [Desulfobulbaceae bacterium]|nr:sugar phosphate isomerase/epimerase [Desulfobulbaceae bacterium]
MKFAFSSNAFRKYSLIETIKILSDIGYEGIEIMADRPHAFPPDLFPDDIAALKKTLRDCNMQVSNINAFMLHAIGDTWHPSWIEVDEELRRQRVEHTKDCIRLAASLGVASISTEPGGPLDGMDEKKGRELFLDGLMEVQELARRENIRVLIEPEPDLLIENSTQFIDFFKLLDPHVFGLNFDIGHFFCVGEDPAFLVEKMAGCTGHYHLEDIAASRVHHHLLPGQGAIDIAGVLHAIKESDYNGFVTVELYPYEDRPIETAREALRFLENL